MIQSIRVKLLLVILFLSVVPLITMSVIFLYDASSTLRIDAHRRYQNEINDISEQIESNILDRVQKSALLLQSNTLASFVTLNMKKHEFDYESFLMQKSHGLKLDPTLPGVGAIVNYGILLGHGGNNKVLELGVFYSEEFVGTDGIVKQHVCAGGSNDRTLVDDASRASRDRAGEVWFQKAMKGETYISSPQYIPLHFRRYNPSTFEEEDVIVEKEAIVVAMPYVLQGEIRGVLMVASDPSFLYEEIDASDNETIELYLVDKEGVVLLRNANAQPGFLSEHIRTLIFKKKGAAYSMRDSHENLVLLSPGGEYGWVVVGVVPEKDILALVYRLQRKVSVVLLLTLACVCTIVVLLTKKITTPIRELTKGAHAISLGRFDHKVSVDARDEFGQLASTFNVMIDRLQQTTTSIDNLNKEMHERKHAEEAVRQSEALLKATLESTADGILVVDEHGVVVQSNMKFASMWQVTDEILHAKDDEKLMNYVKAQLKNPDEFVDCIKLLYVSTTDQFDTLEFVDGRVFERYSCPLMRGESLAGRVWSFRDITRQKAAERERVELEKELAQAQKLESIGTLAAGIAHEINTPVQFIGDNVRFFSEALQSYGRIVAGYQRIIKECGKDEKAREALDRMKSIDEEEDLDFIVSEVATAVEQTQDGLRRVSTIVNAMKDFSHMGQGGKAQADINKAIESTTVISQNVWKYSAELTTDLDPDLPEIVCFLDDINQVVMNLIINATHSIADSLEERGDAELGRISIQTRRQDGGILISVADTGKGIPVEVRDRIFEPFFTTKGLGKGTGQGLSLAYKTIVEKHHGKIWFETRVGKGTVFFVELPLK